MRSVIPVVIVAFGILIGTSLALATELTNVKAGSTTYEENRLRHAGDDRDGPGPSTLPPQPALVRVSGV